MMDNCSVSMTANPAEATGSVWVLAEIDSEGVTYRFRVEVHLSDGGEFEQSCFRNVEDDAMLFYRENCDILTPWCGTDEENVIRAELGKFVHAMVRRQVKILKEAMKS